MLLLFPLNPIRVLGATLLGIQSARGCAIVWPSKAVTPPCGLSSCGDSRGLQAQDQYFVSIQNPVILGDRNEPQPDLMLLKPGRYMNALPTATALA